MYATFIHQFQLKTFLSIIILIIISNDLNAQDNHLPAIFHLKDYNSIQVDYQQGTVFGTNDFLKGLNQANAPINRYQSIFLQVAKQRTGEKSWESLFNYPTIGMGLLLSNYYNEELGTPLGIYGFFHTAMLQRNRLSLNYITRLGFSTSWNKFDIYDNPYNEAIASNLVAYVNLGLDFKYSVSSKLDLVLGASLTHVSNGNIKNPNLGVNSFAPNLRINYYYRDKPTLLKNSNSPVLNKREWTFSAFGGTKHLTYHDFPSVSLEEQYEGVRYYMTGLALGFNQRIGRVLKVGVGATVLYNTTINSQIIAENNLLKNTNSGFSNDKLRVSLNTSHELIINKTSVIIQPSFYIRDKEELIRSKVFHQKIGLKYHFNEHLYGMLLLNATDFSRADFFEWHIAYAFH